MVLLSNGTDIRSNDTIILLVGATGAGKSTFIDIASSRFEKRATDSLEPKKPKIQTIRITHPDPVNEGSYVLVEAPGIDRLEGRSVLQDWLKDMQRKDIELSAIIYLHRISDKRVSESPLSPLKLFPKLCDDNNVVLVTTMWNCSEIDANEKREEGLMKLLPHGSQTARFEDTPLSAWAIIDNAVTGTEKVQPLAEEISDLATQLGETPELEPLTERSEDTHYFPSASEEASAKRRMLLFSRKEIADREFDSGTLVGVGEPLHVVLQTLIWKWEAIFRKLWRAVHLGDAPWVSFLNTELESLGKKVVTAFVELEKGRVRFGRSLRMIFAFFKKSYSPIPEAPPSALEEKTSDNEVFIAVLGNGGSGKSTLINSMTGSELEVFDGGENCARPAQLGDEFEWCGKTVTLIETPSLDACKGHEILKGIFDVLSSPGGKRLDGVIYLQPIFPGIRQTIPEIVRRLAKNLCGESDLKKLVVVRTWDEPGSYSPTDSDSKYEEKFDGAAIIDYPDFALMTSLSTILNPILGVC